MRINKRKQRGQAIIELTVFGAIIIFLIGAIVRQGMNSTQNENMTMKAMRKAMKESYMQSVLGPGDGNTSRNNASFLIVEDRLSAEFSKYGSVSRSPFFAQGSGTFSINLFMPLDQGEPLPKFDAVINGQHFDFTTARFVTKNFKKDDAFYRIVSNGASQGFCVTNCPERILPDGSSFGVRERFDLNRNGRFNDDPQTVAQRSLMSWQWDAASPLTVREELDVKEAVFPSYDVDGDHEEEIIYEFKNMPRFGYDDYSGENRDLDGEVVVLDFQEGDIDFTSTADDYPDPRLMPGLKQEADIYTQTSDGTYLLIQEGAQYDNKSTYDLVSSTVSKGQADVISRMFRLSNDTGRWCSAIKVDNAATCPANRLDNNSDGKVNDDDRGFQVVTDNNCNVQYDSEGNPIYATEPNAPVEACFDCFNQTNISKTCFDKIEDIVEVNGVPQRFEGYAIFVRSRISDTRTRQWITDFSEDVDGFGDF